MSTLYRLTEEYTSGIVNLDSYSNEGRKMWEHVVPDFIPLALVRGGGIITQIEVDAWVAEENLRLKQVALQNERQYADAAFRAQSEHERLVLNGGYFGPGGTPW